MVFSTILDVDFRNVMKNFVAQRTEIPMRYATDRVWINIDETVS